MGSEHRPHVVLLAFPFGTHAAPLHTLARLLAASAPNATFSFIGSAKSNAPLVRVPSPPNLTLYAVHDGSVPDGSVSLTPPEEVDMFLKLTPGNLEEGVRAAVEASGGARVSCVVSDCFLWFAGRMAEEMGVPWVPLWTGGTCSLSAHVYTDAIRDTIGVGEKAMEERADDTLGFVPGLSAVRARDLPEGVTFGNIDSGFARLLHRMGKELPLRATAVVLNAFEPVEPALIADLRTKFKKCLPVGPLSLLLAATRQKQQPTDAPAPEVDPTGCLPWLDRQQPASVAYIGFGTVLSPPPAELAALAEGVEASGSPFLWSMRDRAREHLPSGFLERTRERGLVVSWAPQAQVLGHPAVGAFVTHCGWNSVTESMTGGVPMICRPFFGDQRLNARGISDVWRIGVGVEGGGAMTKEWVVEALDSVLRSEEGGRMRERAGAIKEMAKEAVGSGGRSADSFDELVGMVCGQ